MDNKELQEMKDDLKALLAGQHRMEMSQLNMQKDLESSTAAMVKRFEAVEKAQEKNEAGHLWIHQRIDKAEDETAQLEVRVRTVEQDPVFTEWKSIKKSVVKIAVASVLSVIGILFAVNIPAILKLIAATRGISL